MANLELFTLKCDWPEPDTGRADHIRIEVRQNGDTLRAQSRGNMREAELWDIDLDVGFSGPIVLNLVQVERNHSLGRFEIHDRPTVGRERVRFNWHRAHYTLDYRVGGSPVRQSAAEPPAQNSSTEPRRSVSEARNIGAETCPVAPVARGSANTLCPGELGLLFRPTVNRRWLRYRVRTGNGKIWGPRVTDAGHRARYNEARTQGLNLTDETGFTVELPQAFERGGRTYPAGTLVTMQIQNPVDVTGGFAGWANGFRSYHGGDAWTPVVQITNGHADGNGELIERNDGETLADVFAALVDYRARLERREVGRLSVVSFFCHGYSNGFQLGIDNCRGGNRGNENSGRGKMRRLAELIASVSRPDVVVPIYACSTADRPNGARDSFAALLRDELVQAGAGFCRVDGHTSAGHAVNSVDIRRFEGADGAGSPGIDLPTDRTLREAWEDTVRQDPYFKWQYPFMSASAIDEYLRGVRGSAAAGTQAPVTPPASPRDPSAPTELIVTVMDRRTNQPVEGARVVPWMGEMDQPPPAELTTLGRTTDRSGRVRFTPMPGPYTVWALNEDYGPERVLVEVQQNRATEVTVTIAPCLLVVAYGWQGRTPTRGFELAARTKEQELRRRGRCEIYFAGLRETTSSFTSLLRDLRERNQQVRELHYFSHSGAVDGPLFRGGAQYSQSELRNTPRVRWTADASGSFYGCTAAFGWFAPQFASHQSVRVQASVGFTSFSAREDSFQPLPELAMAAPVYQRSYWSGSETARRIAPAEANALVRFGGSMAALGTSMMSYIAGSGSAPMAMAQIPPGSRPQRFDDFLGRGDQVPVFSP